MTAKVLYVEGCRDGTVGGSHVSLFSMVMNLDRARFHPLVVFYGDHYIAEKLRGSGVDVFILRNRRPLDFAKALGRWSPRLGKLAPVFLPLQKLANLLLFFVRPALVHARFLRRMGVDVVHLNNSINSNHDWMLAAKMARVGLVSHQRGIGPSLSTTLRLLGGSADWLVCISKQIRATLIDQGLDPRKLVVIYNGIDTREVRAKAPPEQLRLTIGIGPNDPVIGVMGNIKEWKGQETVVRATAILKQSWPGIRCVLVGGGAEGDRYRERLENVIRDLGLVENVILAGFQESPADYLNMMDVVVHSSIGPEPFGRVNIEAMYLEKPVVATRLGGPTEIFVDGVTGFLVDPGDPHALADRLSLLLSDPNLRRRIGEAAHNVVMEKFTISKTVRGVQGLYDQICKER